MLRLSKVIRLWNEAAALNDHINLYGFWNDHAFLTKSGDLGMVLAVKGVDYESLDQAEQAYAVKRLESALKAFGPRFHVYQYLMKTNRPEVPFASYEDPVVEAAIDQRRKFFAAKRDVLFNVEIFYVVLLEGSRQRRGLASSLAEAITNPGIGIDELRSQFSQRGMKTLLQSEIDETNRSLKRQVAAFTRQLADFVEISILDQQGQFTFCRRLLNYDDCRIAGRPKSTEFLDYQVGNSDVEAERNHLRVAKRSSACDQEQDRQRRQHNGYEDDAAAAGSKYEAR